eukprot:10644504-Lingulodinium_polyedra.AAC.1
MRKRNRRAMSARRIQRILVVTNPRVRLTARVWGCPNVSLPLRSSRCGNFIWREFSAVLLA